MKWSEIIRLRTANDQKQDFAGRLRQFMRKSDYRTHGLLDVKFYRHASVKGDFTIQLFWDTDQPQQLGSLVGLSFSQALKKSGMVSHSVWITEA